MGRVRLVEGISDEDRELAFANIRKAAEHFGVDIQETSWRDLGKQPHTKNRSQEHRSHRKAA